MLVQTVTESIFFSDWINLHINAWLLEEIGQIESGCIGMDGKSVYVWLELWK